MHRTSPLTHQVKSGRAELWRSAVLRRCAGTSQFRKCQNLVTFEAQTILWFSDHFCSDVELEVDSHTMLQLYVCPLFRNAKGRSLEQSVSFERS